jgi:arylsulfatase A-like enzyme
VLSRFKKWRRVAWLLLPLPLLALAVHLRPQPSPPNILLILVDTLRADRLGTYGNTRGLTPFLDQLASQGTLFEHAYSTTSWTSPAVASLFTSRYPSQHRIVNYDSKLADDEITLATRLRQAGYTTAAFVANSQISRPRGFAVGFTYWWENQTAHEHAADVRRAVAAWLDDSTGSRHGPIFLYVHLLDPHRPYLPPEPYLSRFEDAATGAKASRADAKMTRKQWDKLTGGEVRLLESRYDGEVASVDAEIQQLVADLQRRGLLEHAVVILTADHGEEFMEHGGMNHGRTLNNEVINVPLIVVAAGRAGHAVRENVSLVDIAPTLLDLAGLSAEPRFEGQSFVPLLTGPSAARRAASGIAPAGAAASAGADEAPRQRAIVVELLPNGSAFDLRRHARAIIRGSAKLLVSRSGETEFYDLELDPRETRPTGADPDPQQRQLMVELDDAERRLSSRISIGTAVAPLDEAAKEKLRALGYDPPESARPAQ